MEWSGWTALRHALANRRQRSEIEPFHFGLEAGLGWPRSASEVTAASWDGRIDVTDQRIWLNGLPEAFRGFRILQISDIHHSRFFPLDRVARLVELSTRLQPDLVALTGDFVTYSRASIEPVAEMLGALEARAGVVAVLGNHDFRVGAATIERALRRRDFNAWQRVLPPLTELESLLFRTIAVGFILLTATLLTGVLFVDDLLAQHLVHKTVLSVLSWLAFGALLIGVSLWLVVRDMRAHGRRLAPRIFAGIDESSRKSPFTPPGVDRPPDKQHLVILLD